MNFSLLPPESLPAYGNFFQFFKYGNLGFIVFSGAHTFEEQQTSFLEACEYFDHTRPAFVYLVTHWAKGLDGGLLTGPGAIPSIECTLSQTYTGYDFLLMRSPSVTGMFKG